jgi:hypothetical protein
MIAEKVLARAGEGCSRRCAEGGASPSSNTDMEIARTAEAEAEADAQAQTQAKKMIANVSLMT